ncbi:hypothetical protein [Leucobacter insecticola]|uniref:hypothetical protein n=1 Tax=Leucobacter insecticola TaxID=2714934 RepID=UPI001FCB026E|nr:hypothetical protein [Leucobacter insecticola]
MLNEVAGWQRVLGTIGSAPDANVTARCLAEPFSEAGVVEVAGVVPFDSVRKWSALIVDGAAGGAADDAAGTSVAAGTWVLGAPDFVLQDSHAGTAGSRGPRG